MGLELEIEYRSISVGTEDSALSMDALMQILMQISDEDRQMLSQIV